MIWSDIYSGYNWQSELYPDSDMRDKAEWNEIADFQNTDWDE